MKSRHKLGLIGYGYLGKALHQSLEDTRINVTRVYNRSAERLAGLPDTMGTTSLESFVGGAAELDLVVEVAHPDISRNIGARILHHTDYMPCSVAALADDQLRNQLVAAARAAGTRLLIPHGAVVGIDNLLESQENWTDVTITFRKPPDSLGMEKEPEDDETVLFQGSVREIADKFPRNVNAMVACALATIGPDAAVARIVADRRQGNVLRGEFVFRGKDGSHLSIVKEEPAVGVSSPGMITALKGSVLRALGQSHDALEFV
jgi:aspartate dehydrogenase